jgi:CheY-like chemotaxis protein
VTSPSIGTIQITSAEGLGTRVEVTLAAEQAAVSAIRDREQIRSGKLAPVPVYAPAGTKLLIVDDHPVNLAMLKRQLKILGLEADTASSGVEALAEWRREGYNLVITDLQMPEMDGYSFARAIRGEQDQGNKPTVVAFIATMPADEATSRLSARARTRPDSSSIAMMSRGGGESWAQLCATTLSSRSESSPSSLSSTARS